MERSEYALLWIYWKLSVPPKITNLLSRMCLMCKTTWCYENQCRIFQLWNYFFKKFVSQSCFSDERSVKLSSKILIKIMFPYAEFFQNNRNHFRALLVPGKACQSFFSCCSFFESLTFFDALQSTISQIISWTWWFL